MKLLCLFLISLVFTIPANAQNENYPLFKSSAKGYALFRQYQTFENVSSTSPLWKKEMDIPSLELKGEYYLSPRSEVEFEIEIEHGGTGSAFEYDALEEFGEFETEMEKGGEIVLSEFYYQYTLPDVGTIKVGKIPIFISLGNSQKSPMLYPSIRSSASEPSMIPREWREQGFEIRKLFSGLIPSQLLSARFSLTNGLNSEFFRKYSWVGGGYQRQFETTNANDLAATLALELGDVEYGDGIAIAGYSGSTTKNRRKAKKLAEEATLTLYSIFGAWHLGDLGVRGQVIRGTLDNSDKVSLANSTLPSNVSPGAFSSLGHKAELEMVEVSYSFLKGETSSLTAFMSYEHVNTMSEVEGSIIQDDRYNKVFSSFGLMWRWDSAMYLKSQYTKHSNALQGIPATDDYQLALGFDLQGFNL